MADIVRTNHGTLTGSVGLPPRARWYCRIFALNASANAASASAGMVATGPEAASTLPSKASLARKSSNGADASRMNLSGKSCKRGASRMGADIKYALRSGSSETTAPSDCGVFLRACRYASTRSTAERSAGSTGKSSNAFACSNLNRSGRARAGEMRAST